MDVDLDIVVPHLIMIVLVCKRHLFVYIHAMTLRTLLLF